MSTLANTTRRRWVVKSTIGTTAICAILACSCSQLNHSTNTQGCQVIPFNGDKYWVIAIDGDSFLAHKVAVEKPKKEFAIPAPPDCECVWRPLSKLRQFLENEAWLSSYMMFIPLNCEEPLMENVSLLSEQYLSSRATFSPSEPFEDTPGFKTYREALLKMPRELETDCY